MAFYLMHERKGLLALCPDRREKKTLAGAGIVAGALLLAMAAYSLLRAEPDTTGFFVWLVAGIGLVAASLAYLLFRTEIEFYPVARKVVRRSYGFGGRVRETSLGFDQVKAIRASEEKHASAGDVPEHSFGWLTIVGTDGSAWARVRMGSKSGAAKARKQIMTLIDTAGDADAAA